MLNVLQVAYQVGQYNVATTACQILWEYFVSAIPQPFQKYTYLLVYSYVYKPVNFNMKISII